MKLIYSSLLLLFVSTLIHAQDFKDFKAVKVHTVYPRQAQFTPNQSLERTEMPYPGGDSFRAYLNEVKEKVAAQYPRKELPNDIASAKRSSLAPPIVDDTLLSTWSAPPNLTFYNYGGNPSDHTLALSKDGILLVSWNTEIYGVDLNTGEAVFNQRAPRNTLPFQTFMDSLVTNDTVSLDRPFDPKLRYDPNADRFVFCFLSGRDTVNSETLFAFSSSNDPNDPWYVYSIPGNPLKNEKWSDYPQFSLTEDEVFYTVNLIDWKPPGQSNWRTDFNETIIWQMDKKAGYAGADSIDMRLWHNLDYNGKPIRYSHTVKSATTPKGPNAYFVSTRSKPEPTDSPLVFNDTVFLLEVTNTMKSGNAQLKTFVGKSNIPYITPPHALQPEGYRFETNDGRVLGALIDNGEIHFVGNGFNTQNGHTAVYHGVITNFKNGSLDCEASVISAPYDIGYPNIAYTGIQSGEEEYIIGFNHTDTNLNAGQSAVFYSKGEYSDIIQTVPGFSHVSGGAGDVRWGDYYGIQRDYADPGRIYVAGYKGVGNGQHTVGIAHLRSPHYIVANAEERAPIEYGAIQAYPNPFQHRLTLELNVSTDGRHQIDLVNLEGKTLRLVDESLQKGSYSFSFEKEGLKSGTYFILLRNVNSGRESIISEKVIKH